MSNYYPDEDAARAAGLKPGQRWGPMGGDIVPWRMKDLDPNDTVSFVPREIHSQRYQEIDGEKYSYLTVNGLACVLHLNEINTVNRFFYNAYLDNFNGAKTLEELKRKGPSPAMWDEAAPGESGNYENTWSYTPEAAGPWMDQDGRYLSGDETYSITEPGLEGMPISLGKTKDLIEAGTHPKYKRPPQVISYSIGLNVLRQAVRRSVGRSVARCRNAVKRIK